MLKLDHLAERIEMRPLRVVVDALFIAVTVAFTVIPFIRFLRHGTDLDYRTWFDAAQAVLQHRPIYPRTGTFPFMYPPPCAVALAFPALFGKAAMILLLCCLNTAAWLLCLRFVRTLTGDRRLILLLVPNLIVIVFIWSSYHLGQPSLLLLALMLGAFVALGRKRQALAGALIAGAAAIKAFPVLAIFYLLYRRLWIAAASLLIALFVFLFLLPMPFRGMSQTVADGNAWQRGMLRYQSGGIAQRAGRGYSWKNQSFFGLANRMLRPVSVNDEGEPIFYANIANAGFQTINFVIIGVALILGLSFVAVMPAARPHESYALEGAALLLLILFFTPLAFGYLFSWLMLPIALLTRSVFDHGGVFALFCLLGATALLIATGISPRSAQIYGSVFFAALLLYFGVIAELWRTGRLARAGAR